MFRKEKTEIQYEFCSRCEANLTLQKGYDNTLPYWICRGCGEMLYNPTIDIDDNVVWLCDECGAMLNIQEGFDNQAGVFVCAECGFLNEISSHEMYISEDEFQSRFRNPYVGLSDEDIMEISAYEEVENINGREDIVLLWNWERSQSYVKKILSDYNVSIYRYLMQNPVKNMPRLVGVFEGKNYLTVIEEYIEGRTLSELLVECPIETRRALKIVRDICVILDELHNLEIPIVHRDIKPSNIIITPSEEVYLLDINVAKWYKNDENEDTRLFGTMYYAAPEQFGYGFSASSGKSDIYALGVLLNVMLTGKIPKESKAPEPIWNVIERCIDFNPKKRYTAKEMIHILNGVLDETGKNDW